MLGPSSLVVLGSLVASLCPAPALAHEHHGQHEHGHMAKRIRLPRASTMQRTPEQEAQLHRMFKRQSTNYPTQDVSGPDPQRAWVRTYQTARAAGLIPNIAPAVNRGGNPVYPSGTNGNDLNTVCSWTVAKCNGTDDIINAPDGMIGLSWDDGPQPASADLYKFLIANNIPSTHFMIGSRIIDAPALFKEAVTMGANIAVHTWSHPLMTTMTDTQILGELGWTMQIIYDNTNGLLPMFWRPPYGDVDNRVRAIAKQVFGLSTVIWNQDTNDWCLADDGSNSCTGDATAPANDAALARELTGWLSGSKSPGLIILEHEHKQRAVSGFINTAWPLIQSQNWQARTIPGLFNLNFYQNAADNNSTVVSLAVGAGSTSVSVAPATSTQIAGGAVSASLAASRSAALFASSSRPLSASAVAAGQVQTATDSKALSSGAKIGIIAGAAGGVALLVLLGLCICIRRRRSDGRHAVAGLPKQPYRDLKASRGSDISFESKDAASALKSPPLMGQTAHGNGAFSPNLLYPHPPAQARQSTTSIYSQHGNGDESPISDYYYSSDGGSPDPDGGRFAPQPASPPRAVSLAPKSASQRFHFPTSASASPYEVLPSAAPAKTSPRQGWL